LPLISAVSTISIGHSPLRATPNSSSMTLRGLRLETRAS
jgi:hypothetical protein